MMRTFVFEKVAMMTSNNCLSLQPDAMMQEYHLQEMVFIPPKSSYNKVDLVRLPSLHRAVWKGRLHKVIKYLAQERNTKKIGKLDYAGRTALHLAASCGKMAILRIILSMSCSTNIDKKDDHGYTAFFKAVQNSSLECMKELQLKDCDVNVPNKNKITPVEYLIKYVGDDLKCFEFFLPMLTMKENAKVCYNIFKLACSHNRTLIMRSLLDYNGDLRHSIDVRSYESLHLIQNGVLTTRKSSERNHHNGEIYFIDNDVLTRMRDEYDKHKLKYEEEEERGILLHKKLDEFSQINYSDGDVVADDGDFPCDKKNKSCETIKSQNSFSKSLSSGSSSCVELEKAYEKLLMIQTEKQLELEQRLSELREKNLEINSVRDAVVRLEKEMLTTEQKLNMARKQKDEVIEQVEYLRESIPKEKKKLRDDVKMFEQMKKEKILKVDSLMLLLTKKDEENIQLKSEDKSLKESLRAGKLQLEYERAEHMKLVFKSSKLRAKYEALQNL